MEKTCGQYSFEDINRFVDNELPSDLYDKIALHCKSCATCSQLVEEVTSISLIFNNYVERRTADISQDFFKEKRNQKWTATKKTILNNFFGLFGKNIYLKLSGITAILIIGLAIFNAKGIEPSGPSAIVNYIDTELPFVMILETQKHTIIWFSET